MGISTGTHDVQLVEIDFTSTSITANCQFAVGSPALGCSVHICRDNTPVKIVPVMRKAGDNEEGLPLSAEGMAVGLESGVYTVTVFDIESDGEIRTDGTPAHSETVDITQPTTSPHTTPSPDDTTTNDTFSTTSPSPGR